MLHDKSRGTQSRINHCTVLIARKIRRDVAHEDFDPDVDEDAAHKGLESEQFDDSTCAFLKRKSPGNLDNRPLYRERMKNPMIHIRITHLDKNQHYHSFGLKSKTFNSV
jgi:hypothetical protein